MNKITHLKAGAVGRRNALNSYVENTWKGPRRGEQENYRRQLRCAQ